MLEPTFEHRDLRLNASDGTSIAVEHWFSGRPDVILLAPGFFQSKRTRTFQSIAHALKKRFDVIALDFRGHGDSGGRYHFSAKETADLECAALYAASHHPQVWALGFSYGGTIALLLQSRWPIFAGIVCVGSPMRHEAIECNWWDRSSIDSGRRSMELGAGCRIGSIWSRKQTALDALAEIEETPLLFIHGTNDHIVYPRHSVQMYDAATTPKTLRAIEGGGHAEDLFRTHGDLLQSLIFDWIHTSSSDSPVPSLQT
jgi:pimeloyl-ACP methyl ester carboxylesterase